MRAPAPRRRTAVTLLLLLTTVAAAGCGDHAADRAGPATAQPSSPSVAPGESTRIAVTDAVFASPTGAFLCSLDHGVADCLWPADTTGLAVPAQVCSPAADEGPELRPGHAPGWLCGTDVGVLASPGTIAWAPAGTPTAPAVDGVASPKLAHGVTLTSGGTRCRAVGAGVRCSGSGGWFDLEPGRFTTGR